MDRPCDAHRKAYGIVFLEAVRDAHGTGLSKATLAVNEEVAVILHQRMDCGESKG